MASSYVIGRPLFGSHIQLLPHLVATCTEHESYAATSCTRLF